MRFHSGGKQKEKIGKNKTKRGETFRNLDFNQLFQIVNTVYQPKTEGSQGGKGAERARD